MPPSSSSTVPSRAFGSSAAAILAGKKKKRQIRPNFGNAGPPAERSGEGSGFIPLAAHTSYLNYVNYEKRTAMHLQRLDARSRHLICHARLAEWVSRCSCSPCLRGSALGAIPMHYPASQSSFLRPPSSCLYDFSSPLFKDSTREIP